MLERVELRGESALMQRLEAEHAKVGGVAGVEGWKGWRAGGVEG